MKKYVTTVGMPTTMPFYDLSDKIELCVNGSLE